MWCLGVSVFSVSLLTGTQAKGMGPDHPCFRNSPEELRLKEGQWQGCSILGRKKSVSKAHILESPVLRWRQLSARHCEL